MSQFSEKQFIDMPVVGILRGYTQAQVLKVAEVFAQAGFSTLEITLNTPGAFEIIEAVARRFSADLNVGAGTVLSVSEVEAVQQAGGQFIVSPVVDPAVMAHCKARELPCFPGAYTPTEMYQAWKAGAYMVKVFPARDLGPTYIKDVLAPLNEMKLMPTGGVTLENMEAYLEAGARGFGMGGYLFKKEWIESGDWGKLLEYLRMFKAHFTRINGE